MNSLEQAIAAQSSSIHATLGGAPRPTCGHASEVDPRLTRSGCRHCATSFLPSESCGGPWVSAQFGLATYASAPMTGGHGRVLGTLCAGSREPLDISDAAVAQSQLIAHVIATELRNASPAVMPH